MKKKVFSLTSMLLFSVTLLSLLGVLGCDLDKFPEEKQRLSEYVNPFIGTDGPGNTYPGASMPFGMVQLSPDNGRSGWDWISGYFYPDTVLAGFSHLHLSGTGAGDLYDLSFFPITENTPLAAAGVLGPEPTPYSRFSHDQEKASPGYYSVQLIDIPVQVELTVTKRTGLQKYTFTDSTTAAINLDLGYARNWDWVTDACIETNNTTSLQGYRFSSGWAKDQKVFFYTEISKNWTEAVLLENETKQERFAQGKKVKAQMFFSVSPGDTILVKTGISSVSIENARLNLEKEQTGFNFNKVRFEAEQAWENELGKIHVKTDPDNMTQFYTAMYHTMLGPTLFSDVNGDYKSADGRTKRAETFERYATFSLWDTYRAAHPLATIIHPTRSVDFIQSMMAHYNETGLLPVWELLGNETNMMIGYHAVPVIADAILKNFPGFNYEEAFQAMKNSAMQDHNGLKEYKERGYVPYEIRNWSVSLSLEYAFDDWCIAQVAMKLGQSEDYEYFMARSENYKNHFDSETKFMRARNSSGEFRTPFDPNSYTPEDYCEANAWHYNWYVPHNVDKLISISGGSAEFVDRLQKMFDTQQEISEETVWISGYFGQYVHGNEPSHHVPYLFRLAGKKQETEYWVRKIMDDMYTTKPDGLCGNEDFGQMSAWYVFSALGFYPLNPAGGQYVLGSPQLEEATITLENGNIFKINTINQAPDHVHVKSISLNGETLDRNYIKHDEILEGGELLYEFEK